MSTRTFTSQSDWPCGTVLHRTKIPAAWAAYDIPGYTPTDCSDKLSHICRRTDGTTCASRREGPQSTFWYDDAPTGNRKTPHETYEWVGPDEPPAEGF